GMMGQYIVAWALGIDNISNDTWQSYDLLSPNGKKIEVKTTSYLQVWKQVRKPIPQFKIRKTYAFSKDTGYSKTNDFQADIYVLCYFFENNKEIADVTNLNQWKFWVFQRTTIELLFEKRMTVRVSELEKKFASVQATDLGKVILNY
ncbi:MAG: hypothetical protein PXX83_07515, partial [Candidatus Nitrosotalea sp.]|nr:hypothetical protein [Candidatus Nitrosotalea sp.]